MFSHGSGEGGFDKTATEVMCPSQCIILKGIWGQCLITGNVYLSHLVNVVPAGFLHDRIPIFNFVIDKYIRKDASRLSCYISFQISACNLSTITTVFA